MSKNGVSWFRIAGMLIVSAVFAASAFADAITWSGSTNLTMTANTTVDVPAGTTNVIDTLGGAYTLTKTGGGVLQIRYVKSAAATVIVSQGMLRFANPRPDDIFAQAVYHVDASDRSSMTIETVNGTNFVMRWNDTDGRTGVYATPSTATTYGRVADRYPYIGSEKLNGLSYVDFGSLHTRYYTNELGKARGWGGAMNWNKSVTFKEGFTVVSDTPDIMELGSLWAKIGGYGMSFF